MDETRKLPAVDSCGIEDRRRSIRHSHDAKSRHAIVTVLIPGIQQFDHISGDISVGTAGKLYAEIVMRRIDLQILERAQKILEHSE